MRKRRIQNEAYPIDNTWNYCGWVDYRGRQRLGRAGPYAGNAGGEQLPRVTRLLLLLVVLRGEEMLVLLRRQEVLRAVLQALSLPLLASARVGG
jgi:hypothetical protein